MFIASDRRMKKSPIGATCPVSMPLLTELAIFLLFHTYKHPAPLGLKQSLGLIQSGLIATKLPTKASNWRFLNSLQALDFE